MPEFKSDASSASPGPDPLVVLHRWFEDAQAKKDPAPDAMTLATASKDGRPSARVVLYKGLVRGGVFFVTNYQSRKGRELEENARAALVMHFPTWERQVRVEGRVEKSTPAESEAYFQSRPRGSQLGAWASPQSQPIASRQELEARSRDVEQRFEGAEVARPEHWGGYLVIPERVELWLGRPDRLHDRFLYQRATEVEPWSVERLAP